MKNTQVIVREIVSVNHGITNPADGTTRFILTVKDDDGSNVHVQYSEEHMKEVYERAEVDWLSQLIGRSLEFKVSETGEKLVRLVK